MPAKLSATLATALATTLWAGCENAPPDAGLTNPPSPSVLRAEDKPAMRTDLREPDGIEGSSGAATVPPSKPASATTSTEKPASDGKAESSDKRQ